MLDNEDGTSTFTVAALNANDKITIAGKEYTIGTATGGTAGTAATLTFKAGNAATNFGTVTGGSYTAFQNDDEMKAALAAGTTIKKGDANTAPASDDYTYTPATAGTPGTPRYTQNIWATIKHCCFCN